MADDAHSTPSRRNLIAGLLAAPAADTIVVHRLSPVEEAQMLADLADVPSPSAEAHDAEMLAVGVVIERIAEVTRSAMDEVLRLDRVAFETVGRAPQLGTAAFRMWQIRLDAAHRAVGLHEAIRLESAARGCLERVLAAVARRRAVTLAGLTFKTDLAEAHDFDRLKDSVLDDLRALGGQRGGRRA